MTILKEFHLFLWTLQVISIVSLTHRCKIPISQEEFLQPISAMQKSFQFPIQILDWNERAEHNDNNLNKIKTYHPTLKEIHNHFQTHPILDLPNVTLTYTQIR